MKDIDAQKVILKALYEKNRENRGSAFGICDVARDCGIDDYAVAEDIANQLIEKGFIKVFGSTEGDSGRFVYISNSGIEYVEAYLL